MHLGNNVREYRTASCCTRAHARDNPAWGKRPSAQSRPLRLRGRGHPSKKASFFILEKGRDGRERMDAAEER